MFITCSECLNYDQIKVNFKFTSELLRPESISFFKTKLKIKWLCVGIYNSCVCLQLLKLNGSGMSILLYPMHCAISGGQLKKFPLRNCDQ